MSVQTKPPGRRCIKVGVLIGSLDVGGAERDVVRNFPRLDRDEFDVVVITFGRPGELAPELEREGVRVISRLDADAQVAGGARRVLARPLTALAAVVWTGRTFARERIDVAHFVLPHAYAVGMVARSLFWRCARTVMSRRSLSFYRDSHRLLSWFERQVLHPRVDIALGNSKAVIAELAAEGVAKERLRLVYNGIDVAPFERNPGDRERARASLGLEPHAFVVLAVGNLYSHKGHAELIEACALACDAFPASWSLLLAGRDEEGNRAAYERTVREAGLSGRVRFLGQVDDVAQLLRAADVLVQPSHHEGLPNAVIEAMAASLPVIGTAVGGIPELVEVAGPDGDRSAETGWLVPPNDAAALSAALVEAASDPDRREAMGRRARARAEAGFSVERSVGQYAAVYRELCA